MSHINDYRSNDTRPGRPGDSDESLLEDVSEPHVRPSREDISRRAYELYLRSGKVEGRSAQNWTQAEQELERELARAITNERHGREETEEESRPAVPNALSQTRLPVTPLPPRKP